MGFHPRRCEKGGGGVRGGRIWGPGGGGCCGTAAVRPPSASSLLVPPPRRALQGTWPPWLLEPLFMTLWALFYDSQPIFVTLRAPFCTTLGALLHNSRSPLRARRKKSPSSQNPTALLLPNPSFPALFPKPAARLLPLAVPCPLPAPVRAQAVALGMPTPATRCPRASCPRPAAALHVTLPTDLPFLSLSLSLPLICIFPSPAVWIPEIP